MWTHVMMKYLGIYIDPVIRFILFIKVVYGVYVYITRTLSINVGGHYSF
jgi:hypothetical protein